MLFWACCVCTSMGCVRQMISTLAVGATCPCHRDSANGGFNNGRSGLIWNASGNVPLLWIDNTDDDLRPFSTRPKSTMVWDNDNNAVPACNVMGTDVTLYMDSNSRRTTCLIGRVGVNVIAMRFFSNADNNASVGAIVRSHSLSSYMFITIMIARGTKRE